MNHGEYLRNVSKWFSNTRIDFFSIMSWALYSSGESAPGMILKRSIMVLFLPEAHSGFIVADDSLDFKHLSNLNKLCSIFRAVELKKKKIIRYFLKFIRINDEIIKFVIGLPKISKNMFDEVWQKIGKNISIFFCCLPRNNFLHIHSFERDQ